METIAKIADVEPMLGGKWQTNMVAYYTRRLAELVLRQSGFNHPSEEAIVSVQHGIYDSLEIPLR